MPSVSTASTKASLLLRDSEYIKNRPKEEDFNKYISSASGNEFNINEEDIGKIQKAYNLIKSENINISSDNGKSIKFIFNKLDNEIETEIDIDNKIQPFKIIVNAYILNILNFLGEAVISIKKDSPIIYLTYKNDNLEVKYIIATLGK